MSPPRKWSGGPDERAITRLTVAALILFLIGGIGPWAVRAGVAHLLPTVQLPSQAHEDGGSESQAGEGAVSSCPAPWQRPREEALAIYEASHRFAHLPVLSSLTIGFLWLGLCWIAAPRRDEPAAKGSGWHITFGILLTVSAAAALSTALKGHGLALAAGLMALAPWVLGAISVGVASAVRRRLALGCVLILALQLMLAPIEIQSSNSPYLTSLLGLDIHRLAGTFSTPTALGGFAVTTWAAALSWARLSRRKLIMVTAMTLSALLVVSSATAWIALILVAAVTLYARTPRHIRLTMLSLALPAALFIWFLLPTLTGRSDVHDSAWGRVLPVVEFTRTHLSAADMLFGYRFGVGTQFYEPLHLLTTDTVPSPAMRPPVDSTIAALFWQTGIVGVIAGYALMLLAILRDAASRPLGVALLICSFAFSVAEVLPLAILLAFWLAHASATGKPALDNAESTQRIPASGGGLA